MAVSYAPILPTLYLTHVTRALQSNAKEIDKLLFPLQYQLLLSNFIKCEGYISKPRCMKSQHLIHTYLITSSTAGWC
jgi:hypothetical protein